MARTLQEINEQYERYRQRWSGPVAADRNTDTGRNPGRRGKKLSALLSDVIFYGAIVLLLFAVITVSAGDTDGSLMGYRYYHILTGSMESVYPRGSFVIVKDVPGEEIHIGDDISFYTDPDTVVTHRVVAIVEDYDGSGARGYQTQGTESLNPDPDLTHEANVAGKVVYSIPKLGLALEFLQENMLFVFAMFLVAMLASFLIRLIWQERKNGAAYAREQTR